MRCQHPSRNSCQLQRPVTIASQAYTIRRPGFLTHLSDDEYYAVHEAAKGLAEPVVSPSQLIREYKLVGEMLSALCLVTIFMVAPDWKMPTRTTPRLLNETDLVDNIAELALSLLVARTNTNPNGASLA